MQPILIIQTDHTTVVYIQGQKHIQKKTLLPSQWMKIGEIGAKIGIKHYPTQVKLIHICDDEVNLGVDLSNFPDRVEHLHKEIINVLQGSVNEPTVSDEKESID